MGGPNPSAAAVLTAQLDQAWAGGRVVLDDLSDDEYFWEPVEGCWSVRLRADASRGWGTGDHVCEDAWPPPDPLPVTTIAWRVAHLAAWLEVYRDHTFGDATLDLNDVEVPGTAAAGVEWLLDAYRRWADGVRAVGDDEIFELRRAHWGQQVPLVSLVSLMTIECRHHLAEVGLLRDLRRGHAQLQPPPSAVDAPSWWRGPDG
jgi:hypothetical protein